MTDREGRTELHYAALENDADRVKSLLALGAEVDASDAAEFTPLHLAAQERSLESARELVAGGANVNKPNKFGNTPLFTAVFNARDSADGGELIRLLIASGADTDWHNASGVSPRDLAGQIANYDLARFFDPG